MVEFFTVPYLLLLLLSFSLFGFNFCKHFLFFWCYPFCHFSNVRFYYIFLYSLFLRYDSLIHFKGTYATHTLDASRSHMSRGIAFVASSVHKSLALIWPMTSLQILLRVRFFFPFLFNINLLARCCWGSSFSSLILHYLPFLWFANHRSCPNLLLTHSHTQHATFTFMEKYHFDFDYD